MFLSPTSRKYSEPAAGLAFYDEVLRRMRRLPGVDLAAITDSLPPDRQGDADTFGIEGQSLPEGEIIADPARGTFMGNRGGVMHRNDKTLARRWASRAWITCVIDFKGRRVVVGNEGRVHQIMAAHAMVKIEKVYGTIFENILGEKISTKPVEVTAPFSWVDKQGLRVTK